MGSLRLVLTRLALVHFLYRIPRARRLILGYKIFHRSAAFFGYALQLPGTICVNLR